MPHTPLTGVAVCNYHGCCNAQRTCAGRLRCDTLSEILVWRRASPKSRLPWRSGYQERTTPSSSWGRGRPRLMMPNESLESLGPRLTSFFHCVKNGRSPGHDHACRPPKPATATLRPLRRRDCAARHPAWARVQLLRPLRGMDRVLRRPGGRPPAEVRRHRLAYRIAARSRSRPSPA